MPCLPLSLTSLPGRFYAGARGQSTGSTPEPTASFSKQCRILLTGLKSGTEHRRVQLGSPNAHTRQPAPPGQGPLVDPTHLSDEPPPPFGTEDLKAGESMEWGQGGP